MIKTFLNDVKLYRNGAMLTRTGNVHLNAGTQSVRIGGLYNGALADTVRLSLTEKVSGSNVQVKGLTDEEKNELTGELREKIGRLETQINQKKNLQSLWLQNADFSGRDGISIVDMTDYLEKIPERVAGIDEELSKLNKELEELKKKLAEKKKEADRQFVTADLKAEEEGDYSLQIRYYTHSAGWYPTYELHIDDENEEILIRLRACIRQRTDEDWQKTRVTLYTGDPSISGTIPVLSPYYIRIYEPKARAAGLMGAAKMSRMMDATMNMAVIDDGVEECADEAESYDEVIEESAQINRGDTMIEYELNGLWDIVRNEDFMCDISSEKVPCHYHVVAVPGLDESAYLAAEVKTSDIEDLLQSEASIYNKGTYMGKVYLNADTTKDSYDLSLGKDESIKIKYTQTFKKTSNVLLKNARKTEYEFETRVSSAKPKKCSMMILNHIPVSQDKSVTVEKGELTGGALNEKDGMVKWNFDLEPGETRTLKMGYSVTWPKEKMINI